MHHLFCVFLYHHYYNYFPFLLCPIKLPLSHPTSFTLPPPHPILLGELTLLMMKGEYKGGHFPLLLYLPFLLHHPPLPLQASHKST